MTSSNEISDKEGMLYAGVAVADITPPVGALMNGDFFPHIIEEIHDSLQAKAIVFKSGSVSLAIVIVDTCCLAEAFLQPVKQQIFLTTGIPVDHILIAATHTHSGGAATEVFLTPVDENYALQLSDALVKAVVNAQSAIVPCKITFGSVAVPAHVVSRRYRMAEGIVPFNPFGKKEDKVATNPFGFEGAIARSEGLVDPGLSFLAVKSLEDEWISVLANYSLHYVGDFPAGVVSADYFGFFAEAIRRQLNAPESFVGILSNGSSGNINIWDFLNPDRYPSGNYEKSRLIANDLAAHLVDCLSGMEWETGIGLSALQEKLAIPVRMPSEPELKASAQQIAGVDFSAFETFDTDNLPLVYAYEQLQLAKEPAVCSVPLQLFKIGRFFIGAVPGELFAETGLALKALFDPGSFFVLGLANGNVGYIPPAHELNLGGYETWRCRASKLAENAEKTVVGTFEKLAAQMG